MTVVHSLVGVTACRSCPDELRTASDRIHGRVPASSFHDAGTTLATAIWVVTRHLRPERVVETGVAHGITSAFILAAMELNGVGHLWSLDLPPLSPEWASDHTGIAVGQGRERWTYRRGSVDRHLSALLHKVGVVDLYVHDALHTYRAMTDEFTQAWPRVPDGGVLVSDDVHMNRAFEEFDFSGGGPVVLGEHGKDGAVGVVRKARPSGR